MEEKFVHLHLHTQYSLLDGAARIEKLVKVLAERGSKAVAMTDHGNMYGAVKFYKACKGKGIKPIIGTEFYVAENLHEKTGKFNYAHLIILAKNQKGYENLIKLNSIAWVEGFYYKPRIDYDTLEKYSEGLICSSACLAGSIPQALLNDMDEEAEKLALRLKGMFAPGDFYIEVQNHGIPEQLKILPKLYALADKIGVKVIATNDVHYINREDSEMQDIMMCVQTGKTVDDPDRMRMQEQEFYLKTEEEMLTVFADHPEAVYNTQEVADKCEFHFDFGRSLYPEFKNAPQGMTNLEYLRQLTYEGLSGLYPEITQEVKDRAEMELNVLTKSGYVDYYLVVWDFIKYAKSIGVPVGPGRGSGAASIVAYALGITTLDPLKYELYFERFLNLERISPPDFDIDFDPSGREKVIDYVIEKYGEPNVCQIITFGTMAAKAALKDVGRALKMPYSEVDKLTKAFPTKLPGAPVLKKLFGLDDDPASQAYAIPELHTAYESDLLVQKVVDIAIKVENMPRNTSIHAAGVVICCDEVDKFVPLAKNGDMVTTQFDKKETEALGLLKMDFLGLITLTDINRCLKMVKQNHGVDIDIDKIDFGDQKVYELIASGDTDAVFQVESAGMTRFLKDMQPNCLEDLIIAVAIYRPGPMDEMPTYLKNRSNPEHIEYLDERLKQILGVTYGVMIYQEQVMKICQDLAGYTMGQADQVRSIMGKKMVEKLPAEKERFLHGWKDPEGKHDIDGVIKRGMNKEAGDELWGKMEKFGRYAFNKAHAACYAYVTYQTAFLKKYYIREFYASILNNRITKSDEIKHYVELARQHDIKILPPDVNKSTAYFSVEGKDMRFGLGAIKNVGVGLVEEIVKEREANGNFKDLQDFVTRMNSQAHNKRFLESMIWGGAFDCFGVARSQMIAVYEEIVHRVYADRKFQANGQMSLFDSLLKEDKTLNTVAYPNIPEYALQQKLRLEKDVLGVYISGHPLEEYRDKFTAFNFNSSMLAGNEITGEDEDDKIVVYDQVNDGMIVKCGGIINEVRKMNTRAGNKEMAVITVEDLRGTFDCIIFPKMYEKFKGRLNPDALVVINGRVNIREGDSPIIVLEDITSWGEEGQGSAPVNVGVSVQEVQKPKKMYLKFPLDNDEIKAKVLDILSGYPGEIPVIVKCSSQNKAFALNVNVDGSVALNNELFGVLDPECIKII